VGTVRVDLEAPEGVEVRIRVGELSDADGRLREDGHTFGTTFVGDGTRRTVETIDAYGLHAVEVTAGEGATIHGVTVAERLHPVAGDAAFACSDPVLDRIWEVGRRTVSICSLDAYVDCPTREQRAWTGDHVVHQMVDLATNDDWTLARWQTLLTASPRADGMLPMAVAGDAEASDIAMIPDWALHWLHGLHNLYRYVGDRDEVAGLLATAEGVLRWFEPYLDDDGCLVDVTGWVIIDWSWVPNDGVCGALNGLWGRALLEFAEMASWLGDSGRAAWARAHHERLVAGFERLWDPERQRYSDSFIDGGRREQASQHVQSAALVGGLVPADRVARLVEVLTDDDALVHATFCRPEGPALPNSETPVGGLNFAGGWPEPWWDVGTQVVRAQPFFRYVVHDALVAAGRADLIPAQCRDWAVLLERSAESWSETWFGGTVSHGWSSTPTRDLSTRVLGVMPAVPGFAVATVEPALGDLSWARGSVPTPAGPLSVDVTPERVVVDSPIPFDCGGRRHDPGHHEIALEAR
jgi:alpha-L-rhamnosidase